MSTAVELQVEELRSAIIKQVRTAADRGDFSRVASLSGLAQECQAIATEIHALERRAAAVAAALTDKNSPALVPAASKNSIAESSSMSAKAFGAAARRDFVRRLAAAGIHITGHGKRYHTAAGQSVGVAAANELPGLPNKWFLGLKDEHTDIVALVCHPAAGSVHDFILPIRDLGVPWKALTRHKDQVKFHVRKDASRFFLDVPRRPPVDITRFLGDHTPLRESAAA